MSPSTPTRLAAEHSNSFASTSGLSEATVVSFDEPNSPSTPRARRESSSVQPLPKGAMSVPTSPAAHQTANAIRNSSQEDRLDTPPATPSQRLLEQEHVQFASYQEDTLEKPKAWSSSPRIVVTRPEGDREHDPSHWVPLPLRIWFWVPLVLLLVLGAIGLELALHFSKKNNGWNTDSDFTTGSGAMHYAYTLPPVIIAAFLVAMWTWTDMEIKKMQPYVDLVRGDSPAHKSLLLDYTRTNNFVVWLRAGYNRHYVVCLTSLMVIAALSFQPLAAALLQVRDTWWTEPNITLNNLAAIGLNQNLQFNDLTSFLTASGFAAASVLYNLPEAPFVHGQYTVAPFELPTDIVVNGTVLSLNTTALKSDSGCRPVTVQMTNHTDGSGWTNSISSNGCSISWEVDHSAQSLFGTDTPTCDDSVPEQFSPVIFWFFIYEPSVQSSATLCYPSFTLWDVNVNIDLASKNLTQVRELRPFTTASDFSSLSANVTGAPLNGRAYNGIKFNLTDPDPFVLARQNATQLQMPAAVFQSAVQSPQGLMGSFSADLFVQLATQVYTTYLALIAKTVYFLPTSEPVAVEVRTVRLRVFLSDTAVHLLAAAMLTVALLATAAHLVHRAERRDLRLLHEPGTIASAVSIGAQTGMGDLLAGRQNRKEMQDALQDKKFRIDPQTMKIIMEGEEGYETATSPIERRRSVFAALQGNRASRRFSTRPPGTPTSPKPESNAV